MKKSPEFGKNQLPHHNHTEVNPSSSNVANAVTGVQTETDEIVDADEVIRGQENIQAFLEKLPQTDYITPEAINEALSAINTQIPEKEIQRLKEAFPSESSERSLREACLVMQLPTILEVDEKEEPVNIRLMQKLIQKMLQVKGGIYGGAYFYNPLKIDDTVPENFLEKGAPSDRKLRAVMYGNIDAQIDSEGVLMILFDFLVRGGVLKINHENFECRTLVKGLYLVHKGSWAGDDKRFDDYRATLLLTYTKNDFLSEDLTTTTIGS